MEKLEDRMRSLELEREKKRRKEKERNIIIRGVELGKDKVEKLRERVERIVKETGAIAKVEGDKEDREKKWRGEGNDMDKVCKCRREGGGDERKKEFEG